MGSIFAFNSDESAAHPFKDKKVLFNGKEFDSVRVFKSDFIEKLSHVHPITPLVFWTPIILFLLYRSVAVHNVGVTAMLGLAVAGIFVWTLCEYGLHRFFFHPTMETPFKRKMYYVLHGLHHEAPQDPTRLVMPPAASAIFAAVFWCIFRLFISPVYIEPFFAFFVVGYLAYDYSHYAVHHFRIKSGWMGMVKQNHMDHHYVAPNSRFGLSSPIWDYVFGTTEEPVKESAISD